MSLATELGIDLSELEPGAELGLTTTPDAKFESLVREIIPLDAADLESLELAGPARSQSGVQHIRAYHHNIALRLAAGEKAVAICAALRVTPQTITKLQKDEQFNQLIEHYREKVTEKVIDNFELMGVVATESLMAIHERLCGDERDSIPLEFLRRSVETMADRTGHSPVRRSETLSRHTHELSDATLRRVKALHNEDTAYEAQGLPGEVIETQALPQGEGAVVSISDAFKSVAEGDLEGDSGGGEDV